MNTFVVEHEYKGYPMFETITGVEDIDLSMFEKILTLKEHIEHNILLFSKINLFFIRLSFAELLIQFLSFLCVEKLLINNSSL